MRNYYVIIGSKAFFDKQVKEKADFLKIDDETMKNIPSFMEVIRMFDIRKQGTPLEIKKQEFLIVYNNDYHGIVNAAHDRLGSLIEDLTNENAVIFIHNPPRVLHEYLQDKKDRDIIMMDIKKEKYMLKRNSNEFSENISKITKVIIGQEHAVREISKSLWYLTSVHREKPYVIMLFGNSSLGKTELVREISKCFFDGKVMEKHLSMFKNNNYSDYFFGEEPNRRSIGFDLLQRDSNLIFLDELDKCPDFFYSAFYTLFDNIEFKDATYDVDISGAIIILTSNFKNKEEMKQHLGEPIFYRIDKFIEFADFSSQIIYEIAMKEIESRKAEYIDKISVDRVYEIVSKEIATKNENARTIKFKVQHVIEELLFEEVKNTNNIK